MTGIAHRSDDPQNAAQAHAYVRRIRNLLKREYAARYLAWLEGRLP